MRPLSAIGSRLLALALIGAGTGVAYMAQGAGDTVPTFITGGPELTIDSKSVYNGANYPASTWSMKNLVPTADRFFKFGDIKPGDNGRDTISIHVKKNPAWVCLDFTNWKDKDNGVIEPEKSADANGNTSGELAKKTEFFAWFDDGDNLFEKNEKPLFGTTTQSATQVLNAKTYALADYKHGTAWSDGSTHYVGIAWCAGDLNVNLTTAKLTCNGATMGNEAQTDSFSTDVVIRAVSSKDQAKYLCNEEPKDPHGGGNGGGHGGGYNGHDHYVSHGFFDYGRGACTPNHR